MSLGTFKQGHNKNVSKYCPQGPPKCPRLPKKCPWRVEKPHFFRNMPPTMKTKSRDRGVLCICSGPACPLVNKCPRDEQNVPVR